MSDPSTSTGDSAHAAATISPARLEQAMFEVKKVIVGQDRAIERLMVCLLSGGHALIEGVPGLAKTLAAETLAAVVGGTFTRLQFTPDLLPADIIGTRIYRASDERFDVELGPIFANFVLADEINRAPAKVQSALLEVMAEHQVSIGGTTFDVPDPVPGAGHPEPDRERGRLRPARGPAGPVPDEDRRRLPQPGRGDRDRPPHGRAPTPRRAGPHPRPAPGSAADGRRRLRRPRRGRVRGEPGPRHPRAGPVQPARARRAAGLRGQPPSQPRPGGGRPVAGAAPGSHLRAPPGRLRHRPRCAPPPAGAELRGAGPGPDHRPHPDPPPLHRAGAAGGPLAGPHRSSRASRRPRSSRHPRSAHRARARRPDRCAPPPRDRATPVPGRQRGPVPRGPARTSRPASRSGPRRRSCADSS